VTALLHDIGKLVLMHAYPGYPGQVHGNARTPEERIHRERRELGVDHALVGGVLARRWGLPKAVASVIERHHADDAQGEAAFVRRNRSAACRRVDRAMLSITTKSPYALKALTELGRQGGETPVPIGELARQRGIPVQFLEQLFAVLRRAGMLKSQRGVKGGYS